MARVGSDLDADIPQLMDGWIVNLASVKALPACVAAAATDYVRVQVEGAVVNLLIIGKDSSADHLSSLLAGSVAEISRCMRLLPVGHSRHLIINGCRVGYSCEQYVELNADRSRDGSRSVVNRGHTMILARDQALVGGSKYLS